MTLLHYLQVGDKVELIKCIYSELQQIGGEGESMWVDDIPLCKKVWNWVSKDKH